MITILTGSAQMDPLGQWCLIDPSGGAPLEFGAIFQGLEVKGICLLGLSGLRMQASPQTLQTDFIHL